MPGGAVVHKIEAGAYLTDGERLVCVVSVSDSGCMVEDARDSCDAPDPSPLTFEEIVERWRAVERE